MTAATKPDAQVLRMIETAKAAGLTVNKIIKRGREVALEVGGAGDETASNSDDKTETTDKVDEYL